MNIPTRHLSAPPRASRPHGGTNRSRASRRALILLWALAALLTPATLAPWPMGSTALAQSPVQKSSVQNSSVQNSPAEESPITAQDENSATAVKTANPAGDSEGQQGGTNLEASTDETQLPDAAAEVEAQIPVTDRFTTWLTTVEPLLLAEERRAFQDLSTDYQRDAFIQAFWRSRDPYPQTARNELRERFDRHLQLARSLYGTLRDDRGRVLLVHGQPQGKLEVKCTTTRIPAEVWYYPKSPAVDFGFALIFLMERGTGAGRVWQPNNPRWDEQLRVAQNCLNGDQLQQIAGAIRRNQGEYLRRLATVLAKPRPRSGEWLSTFSAFTTEIPENAEAFEAEVDIEFLGRYQSRTVAQALLTVAPEEATISELAGYRSYEFQLTGEVVNDDTLFEAFRYKFGFSEDQITGGPIPMAFQRFLRPGSYDLVLRLEDLNSGRFYRHRVPLEVPSLELAYEAPDEVDALSSRLFAEATAAVRGQGTSIEIISPRLDLLTGFVRFDTLAVGTDITKVTFSLDGKRLLTKNRPPYNVEIDLGPYPRLHELFVEARNQEGEVVAEDTLLVNSGANRFEIRLVDPKRGQSYENSLLARAEVTVPEDRSLERVEFYLNEQPVATLYQPPYSQPIPLPAQNSTAGSELLYVRAVAYLPDGNSTEDLVFINSPEYLDEIDVQMVELYTTVLDQDGRPVQGLAPESFEVFEDEVRQELARFETVADLPIHVAVMLDTSGSMRNSLGQSRDAALHFFRQAISPKDRAAVITFSSLPNLKVQLTNDLGELGRGLAGLAPEGETALYDSLMFGLYYFTGIKGQRALLLLSDGRDESSRFSFDETLEYARRAGVTIYPIGLSLRDFDARNKLETLADETGGRSFFISDVNQLSAIYDRIQSDLRSQYLLVYQSRNEAAGSEFRSIEVELDNDDLSAKTISGYYP
ncbi:MAG: VWA domain-containing protein [Acidobacteriota bacterium]